MKRPPTPPMVGLLPVAGQAAASSTATARIGDRVGATSEDSSEFAGIPLPVLLIGTAVVAATVVVATDDDSESD